MYETNEGHKMGRIGADPLVGLPTFGQRNYSAAGTRELKSSSLKFKIRHTYCSMYVEGFILESIGERGEIARSGNIPKTWLKLGGWENTKTDPPPDFWRTVVANRGPKGRNAPTFYPRACKESVRKGMHGGTLEPTKLNDEGRCSIVAEFLRRVQAVIWNKRLIRTKPYKPDESGKPDEPDEQMSLADWGLSLKRPRLMILYVSYTDVVSQLCYGDSRRQTISLRRKG
jgi:hypothetical protein